MLRTLAVVPVSHFDSNVSLCLLLNRMSNAAATQSRPKPTKATPSIMHVFGCLSEKEMTRRLRGNLETRTKIKRLEWGGSQYST